MSKIIYCDFHRTERRKEMDAILTAFLEMQDGVRPIPKSDELEKMQLRYLTLEQEEEKWGNRKYWK